SEHQIGKASEREGLLACPHVPDLDNPVPTGRGQALTIRAEAHATHRPGMQLEDLAVRTHVPNADPRAGPTEGQASAVGTEAYSANDAGVSLERRVVVEVLRVLDVFEETEVFRLLRHVP